MSAVLAQDAGTAAADDARRRHFAVFYGDAELAADRAVALVHGNCQAESLRIVLEGGGLATVRMPPVHELTAADVPHLEGWLARAQVLVSQPVRDDFHGLRLGAAQLAARLPAGARSALVPVIRVPGLYPTHAIIRPPSDRGLVPPLVPYHDLRVLAEAAARRTGGAVPVARLDPDAVRGVSELGLAALRAREAAHGTVVVSDLFVAPTFAQMRTLNHPGNPVWVAVAARVRERLGLPAHAGDPGRPLLAGIQAPRLAAVIRAFDLDDEPTDAWAVPGTQVGIDAVRDAHLRWYEQHPDAIDAGLQRHAGALALLGLA